MKTMQVLMMLLICVSSFAKENVKVGLALSGGGVKGGAHIGVLKVLEEFNIPIDYIAGTSAGSMVGGLYAAGYSPDEIEKILVETDWTETFIDRPPRSHKPFRRKEDDGDFLVKAHLGLNNGKIQFPLGVLQGQKLEQLFARLTFAVNHIKTFDELVIPFRAVAADIETGQSVVLGTGSLANAIRASMSIPGLLSPVEWQGKLLVDGGIANNLPIDIVREMGADVVIAVDISAPLVNRDQLDSVLAVTGQLTTILTARNVASQITTLTEKDIYIVPNLEEIDTLDFKSAVDSILPGMEAAKGFKEQLLPYSINTSVNEGSANTQYQDNTVVSFIEFNNDTKLNDKVLLERMSTRVGEPLDIDQLEEDIEQIYSLDVFQEVNYGLIERGEKTGLQINAQRKSWGPNYLQFGLAIEDNFSGNNNYTLGVAYTRTAINSLGGEVRVEGNIGKFAGFDIDYYQPLDYQQRYFFNPDLLFVRSNANVFDQSAQTGEVQISLNQIGLGLGANFGNNQSLKLNLLSGKGKVKKVSGLIPESIPGRYDLSELDLSYEYDSLNSVNFPLFGNQLKLSYVRSLNISENDEDYYQYNLEYLNAQTHGRNTYLLLTSAGLSNRDGVPLYKEYELGGFGNLSGLSNNQLRGPHFGFIGLAAYHRLGDIDLLPAYIGASVELGNVWHSKNDISFDDTRLSGSLFVGVDTFLGPIYLAYGKAEGNEDSFYLFIGNPFGRN